MYYIWPDDMMRISFAKSYDEIAVVFDDTKPFKVDVRISVYGAINEIPKDKTSIFVIGERWIDDADIDPAKRYVFIGVGGLIAKYDNYPHISTAVKDIEITKLIISSALLPYEAAHMDGIVSLTPIDFFEIADGKLLEIADISDAKSLKGANGFWLYTQQTKADFVAVNRVYNELCEVAKDGVFTLKQGFDSRILIASFTSLSHNFSF